MEHQHEKYPDGGTGFDPVAAALASFDDKADEQQPPATLERLRDLAQEMQRLAKEIEDDSVMLAEKQGQLDKISRRLIPDIMSELAMESFTLSDGSKLEVKDEIRASISEEHKAEAHGWLRDNEFDGIIKTSVTLEFGKGEIEQAEALRQELADRDLDPIYKEGVHSATLKAFVTERLSAGDNIPLVAFGVFESKKTKITAPRKTTSRAK